MSDRQEQLTQFRAAAKLLYQQGQYADAINSGMAAVQLGIEELGQDDPTVAEDFGLLGLMYKQAGVYDRAEDCYRYAIDVLRSVKGNDAIELANHLNNLGVLYKLQERYNDAVALYTDALRLRRAHFGENSPEVVNSRFNLAALREAMGEEDAALVQYLQVLEVARGLGAEGDVLVTHLLNNVGTLYGRRKQWSLAEPLLREAVERSTNANGPTHPSTALAQFNFGEALLNQDCPDEAAEVLVPALRTLASALGDHDQRVVLVKDSLARAIRSLEWKLSTADPPLDPASATTLRQRVSEYKEALGLGGAEAVPDDDATRPDAAGKGDPSIAVDISGVDESLRPAVMQAVADVASSGQDAPIRALVEQHPELRAILDPIVAQIRTAAEQLMGGGLPDLVAAIHGAVDPDERAALCRQAIRLVNRDDRPDIWFFVHWALAGALADPTKGGKPQELEDAIATMSQALSVDSRSVPAESWASALSSLGLLYRRRVLGDGAENIEHAIDAYEAALAIPEHRTQAELFASTQNNLANAYGLRTRGDRDENLGRAVHLLEEVLSVTPKDAAPDDWARTQNNLGVVHLRFQRRDAAAHRERAIDALRQALTVRTRDKAPDKWAETMVNLGNAWRRRLMGDRRANLAEARACYANALGVWTRQSQPDKHLGTLNTLAVTCLEDRDAAEFSLGSSIIGPEELIPLTNEELATIAGDYPELAELLEARQSDGDAIVRSTPREIQLARSIMTLCLIERAADRKRYLARHPELAAEQAESVIAFTQSLLGTDGSGDWGETSLAMLEESHLFARWREVGLDEVLRERIEFEELDERASQRATALASVDPRDPSYGDLVAQAAAADDAAIARLGATGTELQRRRFLPRMRARMSAIQAAIISRQDATPVLASVGINLILRRKKIEAELWARLRDAAGGSAQGKASRTYAELLRTRRLIAQKILAVADDENGIEFRKHLLDLRIREERLAIEMAELTATDLGTRLSAIDVKSVATAMPRDSALIDFLRLPLAVQDDNGMGESRYVAAVLRANDPARGALFDLGPANPIDALVAETRSALTGGQTHIGGSSTSIRSFRAAASELRGKIFDPLRESLGGASVVYLSPDGDLARVPFAILPTFGDRYLIDDYELRYVGSGRDLLRFGSHRQGRRARPMVVADPDFELEGGTEPLTRVFVLEDLFGGIPGLASPYDRPLENPDLRFDPLEWGRREGNAVARQLGVEPLVGSAAVKRAVIDCRSPRILHLATHGFFLQDEEVHPQSSDDTAAHRLGLRLVPRHEDPLMRSWLLFAGANRWLHRKSVPDSAGNCVITAMEAATMSLGDTELVVLSACESGLGVVQVGEGVLGLRRAFALAGAQSVIMSLWEVPDRYTRDLMVEFYDRALAGSISRSSALRQAQLVLKDARPDPYFWGAFVCEGEPGPLAKTERKRTKRAKPRSTS